MLLDLDPDLGREIDAREWQAARSATPVNLIRVEPGPCDLRQSVAASDGVVGLIVIDGVISRETAIGASATLELMCHGDVLLTPTPAAAHLPAAADVRLTVLSAGSLILLGQPFVSAAARWPGLLGNLTRRLETQRQRLAIQGLALHLPRAEDRLLLILWQLADCCGRVTPEGIVLPLSLSHEVLARLCAARRPTITLALRALEADDRIRRRQDGQLLLTDAARQRVDQLTNPGDVKPALGPSIILHRPRPNTSHAEQTARS